MTSLPLLFALVLATQAPTGGLQESVRMTPDGAFATVQEAVDATAAHGTLIIAAGTYDHRQAVLTRPITIRGDVGAVLDAGGESGHFRVEADSVTIEGLTLRNTGITFIEDRASIQVEKARFCRIADNRIEESFFGIYLANSGDCEIVGNTLVAGESNEDERETRAGNAIHLWYSTRVKIEDNRIEGHRDGIYFEFVEDSFVRRNVSQDNLRYGLHFMFSDGCTYVGNQFRRNGAGVAVMYTTEVVMESNDFDENRGTAAYGLLLKDITDSRIEGNRFRRNSIGIHAEGANRVDVIGNDFISNGWAVQVLANSEMSSFQGNNFVGNSFDVATNSRATASTFDGNYWDRYRGYDLDRDGTGDVPFRPVRLFSLVVQQNEPALVLQRSPLVALLDLAEAVLPVLTPDNLVDDRPALTPIPSAWSAS